MWLRRYLLLSATESRQYVERFPLVVELDSSKHTISFSARPLHSRFHYLEHSPRTSICGGSSRKEGYAHECGFGIGSSPNSANRVSTRFRYLDFVQGEWRYTGPLSFQCFLIGEPSEDRPINVSSRTGVLVPSQLPRRPCMMADQASSISNAYPLSAIHNG